MFGLSFKEIVDSVKPQRMLNIEKAPSVIKGVSLDTRTLRRDESFLALKGVHFDGHAFLREAQSKGANLLIVQSIPKGTGGVLTVPVLVVKDSMRALGLMAQALRMKFSPQVIAITGSLGKTTTKEMLGLIAEAFSSTLRNKASQNNHIGLPKTLLGLKRSHQYCILELGTNHFGEIEYLASLCKPDAGLITNIADVHLEFFTNRRGVLREKSSLFKSAIEAVPILNGDDPFLSRLKTKQKPLYFGSKASFPLCFKPLKQCKDEFYFKINSKYTLRLRSIGCFNVYNAAAALTGALYLGLNLKQCVGLLSDFRFPKMRLQVCLKNGVRYINDAYNSNPTALKEALKAVACLKARKRIAVLADMLELGKKTVFFHKRIAVDIGNSGFSHVILLGEYMHRAGTALVRHGVMRERVCLASSVQEARRYLKRVVGRGDLVFLKGSRKFRLEQVLPFTHP